MRCAACSEEVPEGTYCTRCGARQESRTSGGGDRTGQFAASPDEKVAQPAILSSIFPHLGRGQINEFRWALLAGVVLLVILYAAGLITAALLVAAVLVPVLYVMYLYEARVYRDAPVTVVGLTIGGGMLLGVALTLATNALQRPGAFDSPFLGVELALGPMLLTGIALPLVMEAVKPLPALLLRGRRFPETIDGLVFGIAAGLGFSLAQTVVRFAQVVTSIGVRSDPADWLLPLLSAALLLPLMHGGTTGAITAALWRLGRGPFGAFQAGAIVVALGAHVGFELGSQIIRSAGLGALTVLIWQALVVAGLTIYVRYLLHFALVAEARDMGFANTVCAHCGRHVIGAGFCPNCGMALAAAPDTVRRSRQPLAPTEPSGGQTLDA